MGSTELEFKRTPGFQTIKRRDRRRAARFDTTPYKPPKKPADFVQFSPEKQVDAPLPIQQNVSIPVLEKTEEKKMTVPLTPNVNKKKNKFENKPSLDLQPTVPITPPSKPQVAVSSNNILGLTSTPPPLLQQQKEEKTENEKEAASNVWKWGSNDDKKEKKQENKVESAASNPFGSLGKMSFDDNKSENNQSGIWGNNIGQKQEDSMDPLSVYKDRLTKIYQQVGQQSKLQGVLGKVENNKGNIPWIHSLYIKVCTKYNLNPEPMVGGNQQTQNNQQSSSGSGWGNNQNNNN